MMQQLPFSREAEEALIGSVLIDPEAFKVLDITPDDFYLLQSKEIWAAFRDIVTTGKHIDHMTVANQLDAKGQLKEMGGQAYLLGLLNATPTAIHAQTYAQIVRGQSRRRQLIRIAGELANQASDQNADIDALIPSYMTRLVQTAETENSTKHISAVTDELYDAVLERSKDPKEIFGLETGVADFDKITAGLQPGELVIISGIPGLGKSILAVQMACGVAKHGHPAMIYEMEMGGLQTVRRVVSAESGVGTRKMRTGFMADGDWQKFTDGIEKVAGFPVYISDSTSWTTASVRADLVRLKALHNIKMFVIDYLFLLKDRYGKDENERIGYVSKALKDICKDLNLSCVAISSMNKGGFEAGIPGMQNLKGSAQVPYDADLVMQMTEHVPSNGEAKNENMITNFITKYREDTASRFFHLTRIKDLPTFGNVARMP